MDEQMKKTPYYDGPCATASRSTLKQLFEGNNIPSFLPKLPEWNGFWFKYGNEVFVFTKDNLLSNTPDYEHFGDRDDWEAIQNSSYYHFDLSKRFIKAMRVRLDEIYQRFDALPKSREVASAKTGVQTAFMFLGLELAYLGSVNPYPESMNPANTVIENPQDKWDAKHSILTTEHVLEEKQIEFTKWLRLELQFTMDAIKAYRDFFRPTRNNGSFPRAINLETAIIEVTKGKLWAGQQLNNFNEEIKAQEEENNKIAAANALAGEGTANRKVARPQPEKP